MTAYRAPVAAMRFTMETVGALGDIAALPSNESCTNDLVGDILHGAAQFGHDVLVPLNAPGDREGCRLENGVVRTPAGCAEAYARFVADGWNGLSLDPEHGGQGLPVLVGTAVQEIWHGSNMAFALCTLLNQYAAGLVSAFASSDLKRRFLPKLISGEWNGTMNLTEPQAGSDLGSIRTRARPQGDHYGLFGQKIFITFGDHDWTANVVHLVLARIEGAPQGIKGLSVFLVPKVMVAADGSLGARNDVRCLSLERKLGIHASPTCVMSYGDDGGAVGYLVGEVNQGIQCMFHMMNGARLGVGQEGVGVAEAATQMARAFARERRQGRPDGNPGNQGPIPIEEHPDVRRMLLSMRARTDAARALAYYAAAQVDLSRLHPSPAARDAARSRLDLMTPLVKACCTEAGTAVADTGIQVHGGAGYVEDTGAAQFLRDVRIAAIYEGTNGIQARDLALRKVLADGGGAMESFIADMRVTVATLQDSRHEDLSTIRTSLGTAVEVLAAGTAWLLDSSRRDIRIGLAAATPYLHLAGATASGCLMARQALAAAGRLEEEGEDRGFLASRISSARFYAATDLAAAAAHCHAMTAGAPATLACSLDEG